MSDELTRIKEISIVEYARFLGFTPKKVGSYFTLKEHDSVRIDPNRNIYKRFSRNEGGSVIDFVKNFENCSLGDAIKKLKDYSGISAEHDFSERKSAKKNVEKTPPKEKKLVLPEAAKTMRNVIAYLNKTRMLSMSIVQEMIDRKMLYQDTHNNCVFVSRNTQNEPVFACLRGTNTSKRFVGDCEGANYKHCFFCSNNAQKLIVAESVIDAMSVMDMFDIKAGNNSKHKNYDYLVISGTSKYHDALVYHLGNRPYTTVITAVDNDEAGQIARDNIKDLIKTSYPDIKVKNIIPKDKDVNESLQNFKKAALKNEMDIKQKKEEVEL